jgi:hypothetical protein
MTKLNQNLASKCSGRNRPTKAGGLHPSWFAFIRHCQELGYGEISNLKIQDGVPIMAEEITKKVKFI